jgi:hypothetical protein
MQNAGIFYFTLDLKEAESLYELAKKFYPSFEVVLLNLKDIDDRIRVIDIDPDFGDLKEGYVIAIIAD